MRIVLDKNFYSRAIGRCNQNIDFVKKSHYDENTKEELLITYEALILKYRRKLLSFSKENNANKLAS